MTKKKQGRFKNKPTGLAAYVGRALGKLAARRDSLARKLAGVEREIADVQKSVGSVAPRGPMPPQQGVAGKAVRPPMPEATRRRMADAAKARWAVAKKAGRTKLG